MIGSNFYLRPVTLDDVHILYQWRNEKLVRQNSFETQIIPFIEHQNWLQCVLQDKNILFYIMMCDDKEVGQVRINIENNFGMIDYSIHLRYRCMGYGKTILKMIENEMYKIYGNKISLVGKVKNNNVASQKIFEQLGYTKEDKEQYIQYTKYDIKLHETQQRTDVRGGFF